MYISQSIQIWMDHQNMSEHVLCMVLYLIELGLDNQVHDIKPDEVRCVCHENLICSLHILFLSLFLLGALH